IFARPKRLLLEVDGHLCVRLRFDARRQLVQVGPRKRDARNAQRGRIAEKDLGETFRDDGFEAVFRDGLWRVLARRAAPEVSAGDEDRCPLEARIVQRVACFRPIWTIANVLEQMFSESVEGHALEKPRRDDAIGVDVFAWNVNGATSNAD